MAVDIANDAPSGCASRVAARTYCIEAPPGEAAETVQLMFEILGWQAADVAAGPRLRLWHEGTLLRVGSDDPDLVAVLARNGLDRLLLPLALPALEQLMVCAG